MTQKAESRRRATLLVAIAAIAATVAAVAVHFFLSGRAAEGETGASSEAAEGETFEVQGSVGEAAKGRAVAGAAQGRESGEAAGAQILAGAAEEAPAEDEAARAEREETALVDAFDSLTDKWMEPAKAGVSMEDIEAFSEQFRKVPKARREECLQRALNLVPDENVMLLAGILMDKTQEKDLVELVFNDILNRADEVKKPIMQQIFKDKSHPCWADTAWILDVTGELPGKRQ